MSKMVYGFLKDELGGKVMKEFVALRGKHMHTKRMMTMKRKKAKGTTKKRNKMRAYV